VRVCVCVRMFWRQELTDAIAQDIRKMPDDEAKGILDKLVGPGDYPNPKKDLSDLAKWERLVQLRRDAPIREHPPPAPSPHFPTQSAAVGTDIFQGYVSDYCPQLPFAQVVRCLRACTIVQLLA